MTDKVLGVASGALGLTKAIADSAGADNVVSQTLDKGVKGIDSGLSPEAQADRAEQSAIMEQAKGKGVWDQVKAGASAFGVAPVQTTAQGVGSAIPFIAASLAGAPVAAGMGVAAGVGTVKSSIFEDIKKRGTAAGMSEADAAAAATKAQEYTGENQDQIALGGVLGVADALTGVSRIGGNLLRNAAGKPVAAAAAKGVPRGILARTGLGAAEEMPLEAVQGGQEVYAANVAANRAGYGVDPMEGVFSNATLEALASAGPGAGLGALNTGPTPPPAAPLVPPTFGGTPGAVPPVGAQPAVAPAAAGRVPFPTLDPIDPNANATLPSMGYDPSGGTMVQFPDGSQSFASELPKIDPAEGPLSKAASMLADAAGVVKAPDPAAVAQSEADAKAANAKGKAKGKAEVKPKPVAPTPVAQTTPNVAAPAGAPPAGPIATAAQRLGVTPALNTDSSTTGASSAQATQAVQSQPQPAPAGPAAPVDARADQDVRGAQVAPGPIATAAPADGATPATPSRAGGVNVKAQFQTDQGAGTGQAASPGTGTEASAETGTGAVAQTDQPAAAPPVAPATEAGQPAAQVAGKAIDGEWTAFSAESGTKGVPRADMPQIKSVHRGAMTNFLNARGITHEQVEVDAASLKPTQAEFSPGKVAKAMGFTDTDRSILISSDGHVLDGHHQWLAKMEKGEPIKAIRLNAPIDQLMEVVKEFPSAATAEGSIAPTLNPLQQRMADVKAEGSDGTKAPAAPAQSETRNPGGQPPSGSAADAGPQTQQPADSLPPSQPAGPRAPTGQITAPPAPETAPYRAPEPASETAGPVAEAPKTDESVSPAAAGPSPDDNYSPSEETIIEHTTGKGKVLRGVVRQDLTLDEAKAVDPGTFKKNGGYFIREKYLPGAQAAPKLNPLQERIAKAKKADAPKEIVKGEIGMKLEAGQIVTTSSGRQTTPFPKVDMGSNGKANNTIKRVDAWLISNALAEAQSRGDTFNERQFQAVNNLNPTQSDKDSAEEYLFGEQPKVVPSILKPLVQPAPTARERWEGYEIVDSPRAGKKLVREPRGDGSYQNLAEFTPGRRSIEFFFESPSTRTPIEKAIDAWSEKQSKTKKPVTPQIPNDPAVTYGLPTFASNGTAKGPAPAAQQDAAVDEVKVFGESMRRSGLGFEMDGLDPKQWSASYQNGAELHVSMLAPKGMPTIYKAQSFVDGKPYRDGTSQSLVDFGTVIAGMRDDVQREASKRMKAAAPAPAAATGEAWWNSMTTWGRQEALKAAGYGAIKGAVKWDYLPEPAREKLVALIGTPADPIVKGAMEYVRKPEAPAPTPAPAPAAAPDPLSDQAKAAKAKMLSAAGKLAQLLSKNTRMNITPEQEQAMLPIVIELFEGAMELGYVKFKQAARYVREFIAGAIDQDAADSIPIDTLQGAYIATARRHKDKDITSKADVIAVESVDELTEPLEPPAEKADTAPDQPTETLLGASNDTGRNAADDRQLLDDAVPQPSQDDGQGGDPAAVDGLRTPDPAADGRPADDRTGRGDGLDGDAQPVLPGSPAEIRPLADGPVGRTEERPDTLAGKNPGNFEITFDLRLGEGTDGQKIKANLDAIRTLRLVQKERRFPTNEEQRVMARYVGWGGLKTVFDPKKKDATDLYGKAQRELRELLNPQEYRAANGSIRNAHYTAQGIVEGMWRVARHMGFKGGRVLEPTVGIGNFIGLQPKDMAASSEWHASELDTVTGEMAAMLYPEANVLASTGFQDAPFADDAFDLVIGNPPFGQQTIDDKHPNRKHLSGMKIHNYIIAKSGMHLRPGGVMSLVVTHRFLDTANPEARDVLASDFKFLGAFRLPNNAFAANAGTEVVTDVIFLQKLRPDEARDREASWLDVNGKITVDGQDIRVNRYYQDNPTHILGRSATDGTMYGGRTPEEGEQGEYTVHGDGRDLGQAIDNLITGGFAGMAGIMERTGSDMSAAPAMLMQSDLPVGGVMLDDDGKIRRRELDDAYGNAVVVEITPETLWKEQAAEWQALQTSLLDIRERAKNGRVTAADAEEFLALARFTFKSDGTMRSKPTKAEAAVYKLVDALARPASFTWTYDDEGLQIGLALARKQLGADGYKSLKGMLDLRNRALRLIRAEQTDDPKMEELRTDLNTAYDAFVKANGFLSDPRNSNLLDGDIGVEAGLEASFNAAVSAEVSKSTGIPARKASATKADILKQRVNFPYREITTAATSADALSVSLSEHGKVDLPYMAKITGKSILEVINDLSTGENPQLFRDPETNEFQEAERYLSGNVRHKLDVARERNETANIKALEKVQPEPKTKSNVTPNIRGMWVPEAIFSEFLQAIGYRSPRISILASQGIMTAEGGPIAITDFGTQFRHARATPVDMFNAAVAGKPLIIYDKDSDGNRVRNDTMTKEVTALVDRMAKVFQEWAYSDDRRADAVVAAFNEKMNTHVKRTYDGVKYLRQIGASPSIKLRRTQKNAAWRMIQEQTMLADHVVGAGKTFTLITGIMERRRMGLSRKPMVAVPNHLVVQWARDFYKLYPSAKVLAATPADFARKNRRRLLARIATGDYDAIIIGHSSLGFIETPADDLRAIVDEKLAGLRETMVVARANKESKRTLGQIEDRIERYEARLTELAERPTDEIGIDFKSMGIDHLSVDEAHEFKNLEYSTSGDRVKGMNDPNGSKKAFDLYSKVRGLLGRNGGVVFATGTPVSNSLVEIYTVMSYLAHDELKLRNQDHFDAWSGAYASTETRLEYTSTQKLKPARVLAGLNNLSALRQLYEQFADIITMADLKRIYAEEKAEENKRNGTNLSTDFPIPRVRYGARQLNSGPVTKAQQEYMDYLVARMTVIEQQKSNRAYPAIDNPLNVLTDARKMSLDIRIVDPMAPRDENGKVMRAAKNIKAAYDASDANRGTQLVFCDLSTPAKTAAKDAKRMVTEALTMLVGEKQVKATRARSFDGKPFEAQWKLLREAADRIIDDPATDEQRRDQVSEYFGSIEDAEATMLTADIGFSVYDDMRNVLVEMGIPEAEIAFIHDYNTPEQKEKLFDRVNNGYIRVLMGSTMKMGAGTNAQRRMVALHHMDAPWRPSDVEQREGRIIRQGNLFATLPELIQGGVNELYDPEFEVGIDAYSTENTSDTVMWQVLERKAGAIEQFRAGGLDSTEEEGADSNQYAEFMASSTGNPVFRLKLEAERKLTELTADISGALITRSNAAAFMQQYESRRAESVAMRDAAQAATGFTSASYGGQNGTVAEYEAAMKDAEAKYMERFAEYQTRRSDAEVAIAAWELQPESTRGEKPKVPTAPSRPNLMTNTVQAGSGFARAIGLALKEARVGKQTTITLSDNAKIVIDGEEVEWKNEKNNQWYARLQMGDQKVSISFGSGLKATDSSKLVYDLTPANIAQDIERALRNASEQVADLDARKVENERRAKLDIDTSKRDAAEAELRWYERQVRFAEIESDVRRSSRPNRYIARDRRRPLGQMAKVDLAPVQTIEVDGETYTTTGVQDGSGSYMNMQATRDSDGLPAVVQIRTAQGKNNETETSVVLQPSSIPFKPKPGKSTNLRQTGAPEANETDIVFNTRDDAPFYSALSREVGAIPAKAQAGVGWAMNIAGLVKAGKVKQDEVDWSGVLDWLKLQEGKVTREQLVQFLDANGVRVEETVLGGGNKPPGYDADLELLSDNGLTLERNPEDPSMVAFMDENGDLLSADELAEEPGLAKELVLAAYRVQEAADADKVPTRYANYQLPGGSNYREVLLTLPTGGPSQVEALSDAELRALILRNDSNAEVDDTSRSDLLAMISNMDMTSADIAKLTGKNTAQYKSSHWDLPNVLAHIRVNDRTSVATGYLVKNKRSGIPGQTFDTRAEAEANIATYPQAMQGNLDIAEVAAPKRVLFVEEIQSDWGQDGKKRGFGSRPQFSVRDRFGHMRGNFDSEAEAQAYIDNPPINMHNLVHGFGTIVPTESVGIPTAPFVTKTDAWLSLALKRIVKMAVDEGYDRVAFISGEQSKNRYKLSLKVSEISWRVRKSAKSATVSLKNGDDLTFHLDDAGIVQRVDGTGESTFDGKSLDQVVGKDVAAKIMAEESGVLAGDGMDIGGRGMVVFYDKLVPNILKDVLRKVGGGALETVDIGDGVTSIGMVKMSTRRPATESEAAEHIDRTGSDEGLYIESDGKVIPVDDAVNFYPDQYDEGSVGDSYINAIINRGYGSKFYIERENAPMPQPGFTITPAMRDRAAGGLPMFAQSAYTPADGQAQSTPDTSPNAARNIRDLSGSVSRYLGAKATEPTPFEAVTLRDQAALQRLAAAFNGTIQGFRTRPTVLATGKKDYEFFNGTYTNGVIFLRDRVDRPHLAILGHETAHQLARTNPALYTRMVEAIRPYVDQQKYRSGFANTPVARGVQTDQLKLQEEFIGEILSDGFMDRDFWMALGKKSPGLLQSIAHIVTRLVRAIMAGVGYTKRTDEYLTDYKKVMQIAGEIMGEYGLPVPTLSGGGIAFDRKGDQTDTAEFKAWFKDSKVVDSDGNPMVVYHGTDSDFATFNAGRGDLGKGIYFASAADDAASYASPDGRGANVMPVYVSIQNPYYWTKEDRNKSADKVNAAARRAGHDGIIRTWAASDEKHVIAFDPTQIKSAIGNRGTFDPANADIRFNRIDTAQTLSRVTETLKQATSPIGTVSLWDKTVGTQYHKATKDADFKKVFDGYVQQTDDTAHYAIEAERLAPSILMRLESMGDVARAMRNFDPRFAAKQKADLVAVSKALFANIEGESGVKQVRYDERSLREIFNLTPKQIEMYYQARAAVDQSIERLAQTFAAQMGRDQGLDIERVKNFDLDDTVAIVKEHIQDAHDEDRARYENARQLLSEITPEDEMADETAAELAKQMRRVPKGPSKAETERQLERLDKMVEHARFLQENAYMPAMRFGEYAVTVADQDGEVEHFEMFESQMAANLAAIRLGKEYPKSRVHKSVMNPEQYAMFKGVSPETVELFAKFTGMDQNEAYQDYIALAKSARSVKVRELQRKGIAGFSEDATRVMASFLTSNARQAAINVNIGDITDALASKTLARKGDVQREAQKLHQYMSDPLEEARRLRGFLFLHFIGGSIASAMVNLTQPVLQTAPYLSQFAKGKTARIMAQAAKMATTGKIEDKELRAAAKRAAEDGITEPHEIHQLMADASGSAFGGGLAARAAVKAWGGFFSLAEAFNRRLTFLAAYQTAKETGEADPYEFARKAVIETQGLYAKANRPNWARGGVGATLFTFKQFSISYVEFILRMPRKQKLIALGVLLLVAGAQGLPFAEDVEDLIDTIGQSLGYNTNSKKLLRQVLAETFGETLGEILNTGIFSQTGVDVHGRLGMGNLIPGTAIFLPSETDKSRTLSEVAGPLGGILMSMQKALAAGQRGDLVAAGREMAPIAVKNLLQGADMAQTGVYKDSRGYKVTDVDALDSFYKMLGLQPGKVAKETRKLSDALQDKSMVTMMEGVIADRWAAGVANKEPDQVAQARATLKAWNDNNPAYRIVIKPTQIMSRVRKIKETRADRFIKTAPREVRGTLAQEIQ